MGFKISRECTWLRTIQQICSSNHEPILVSQRTWQMVPIVGVQPTWSIHERGLSESCWNRWCLGLNLVQQRSCCWKSTLPGGTQQVFWHVLIGWMVRLHSQLGMGLDYCSLLAIHHSTNECLACILKRWKLGRSLESIAPSTNHLDCSSQRREWMASWMKSLLILMYNWTSAIILQFYTSEFKNLTWNMYTYNYDW